jgi:hypothetical protein
MPAKAKRTTRGRGTTSGSGKKREIAKVLAKGLLGALIAAASHQANISYQTSQLNKDFGVYHLDNDMEPAYQPIQPYSEGSGRRRRRAH